MNSRVMLGLVQACFAIACSKEPQSPIAPAPTSNSLTIESLSTHVTSGDYRIYAVRIRVRETAGGPVRLSEVAIHFVGAGIAASRTFSNIPNHAIAAHTSVELDDFTVTDEAHQFDSATEIVATVTYRDEAGKTWAAAKSAVVPNCANHFDIWGPSLLAVGKSIQLFAGLETGCSPMFYPLNPSSMQWRSLTPEIADVNTSGLVTGRAHGLASIQGTYGHGVSTHTLRVSR